MKNRKTDIKKELEETAPFLAVWKEKGEEGFETPPAYFRELPDRVMNRLKQEQRQAKTAGRGWQGIAAWLERLFLPRYAVGLATVLLLVAGGIYLLTSENYSSDTEALFSALSPEEVDDYISANLHQFDEELMLEIARSYPDLSVMPAPTENEEEIDSYFDELLQEFDEESLEEIL